MKAIAKILLTGYLVGMTVYAVLHVGEFGPCEAYKADLPFTMFTLLAFPAVLGYTIGKE